MKLDSTSNCLHILSWCETMKKCFGHSIFYSKDGCSELVHFLKNSLPNLQEECVLALDKQPIGTSHPI